MDATSFLLKRGPGPLLQIDSLQNLSLRPVGGKLMNTIYLLRAPKTYETRLFTMNTKMLSKYSINGDLKDQKSKTRWFLGTSKVGVSSKASVSILSSKKYIGSTLLDHLHPGQILTTPSLNPKQTYPSQL